MDRAESFTEELRWRQSKRNVLGLSGWAQWGSRMAQRLLAAGYPLAVYNRTRAKAEPVAEDHLTGHHFSKQ